MTSKLKDLCRFRKIHVKSKAFSKPVSPSTSPDFFWRQDTRFQDENLDTNNVKQLVKQKKRQLYQVQDIKDELESMTEDEGEIEDFQKKDKDTWKIKQTIRASFKQDFTPPVTQVDFY